MEITGNTIDPIPIEDRLLDLALAMKRSGLPWTPHVGCFVWDREGVIAAPSPFSKRVYFILSMPRFLRIFGGIQPMQDQLVWLPTWYQAAQLCRQMGIHRSVISADTAATAPDFAADELARFYQAIRTHLESRLGADGGGRVPGDSHGEEDWIRRVMAAELGSLSGLPDTAVQQVERVYREVATAYLGWRRIQAHQDSTWLPPETSFDAALIGELGHFFSDYQHQIRTLEMTRRTVNLLTSVDSATDPDAYDQLVQLLLEGPGRDRSPSPILAQLIAPDETHAAS